MKNICKHLRLPGTFLPVVFVATSLLGAAPTGQWDFNSSNLTATVGTDLQYADGPGAATQTGTSFDSTTSFGIPDIGGTPALVMKFPPATNGMGYNMPTPAVANGGGILVNQYTLVLDVLYPGTSDNTIRPIIDTDGLLYVAGPDLIVSGTDAIGITPSGPYSGTIASNTWYRIGFVVIQDQNVIYKYIDGVQAGINTITGSGQTGPDGRFALTVSSLALILGSTETNAAAGYVNSIQVRDVPLNSGQMKALGGPSAAGIPQTIPPVPSFIDSRTPDISATGVYPEPKINVVLIQGDTVVDSGSIKLLFDESQIPASVVTAGPTNTIAYSVTNLLEPSSVHTLQLIYSDSVAGLNTNTWSFTVAAYEVVTLPAPFVFENFEGIPEGSLPAGWTVTNATDSLTLGIDYTDPKSDAFLDWVVITTNDLFTAKGGDPLLVPPIAVNGVLLTAMANGQLAYAESDSRGSDGNQVQDLFSPDFDCTGKTNVYVSFHSIYEQNQDSLGAVEYSVDQGATWLPALYMLDDEDHNADVVRFPDGTIDAVTTLNQPQGDTAYLKPYGYFIGAPVSQALAPFISGRINDNNIESIRVEVLRLAAADGQPKVRLRFIQTGTASWWFAIDDLGLYTINTPVISVQPLSQTIDAATPVTFSVTASSGTPLTYQWKFNGNNIIGATTNTYTINSVFSTNAGQYKVVVSNSDGPVTSAPATLTVITAPQILAQPLSQVLDPTETATFSVSARGGQPLTYQWTHGGSPVGLNTNVLTVNNVQSPDQGDYAAIISNTYGSITSSIVHLTIFSGAITNGLVLHLQFDGNYDDSSGRGNNAVGVGSPGFVTGKIGSGAFQFTTKQDGSEFDYATLGYPNDLKFTDTNDFSISMWVNYTNQVDDPPFISNKNWDSSGNVGWGLFTQSVGDFRINVTGTSGTKFDIHPTTVLRDGTWHNLVVSFVRSGLAKTYVDGLLVNSTPMLTGGTVDTDTIAWNRTLSSGPATGPHAVNIGQDGTGAYNDCNGVTCPASGSAANINGKLDDVGIWRRGITPNEAASIYTQGQQGKDLTTASGAPVILPPSITTQPVSQTVNLGSDVSFFVVPGGTPPFTYQWLKGVTNLVGQTSSNLDLTAVQPSAFGDYSVVVANGGSTSATSQVARLEVFTGAVSQNLVVHLKFDGDYIDSSGRNNNASAVGSPGFAAGKIGQAMHFVTKADGSDFSYTTLGYPTDLKFDTNDFSVSFWVDYSSAGDDPAFMGDKNWDSSSNTGWGIFHQDPTDYLRVSCTGTPRGSANRMDATLSGPSLKDGNWHHIAVSFWRGQNASVYVDGSLVNVTPLTIVGSVDTDTIMWTRELSTGTVTNQHRVNIGQDGTGGYNDCNGPTCPASGSANIDGLMDDVGIWRRVLTPQEAAAIFSAGQSGKDLSQAVVGGSPTLGTITAAVTGSGSSITFNWTGGTGIKLQTTASLAAPNWQDVPGTTGSSSIIIPIGPGNAFYRLIQ